MKSVQVGERNKKESHFENVICLFLYYFMFQLNIYLRYIFVDIGAQLRLISIYKTEKKLFEKKINLNKLMITKENNTQY